MVDAEDAFDNNNTTNLFSGEELDTAALAVRGDKMNRRAAAVMDLHEDDHEAEAEGDALFSGDIHGLDAAALTAQAAKMAALVEAMEANLESEEVDLNHEKEQWSVAAKISSEGNATDDQTYNTGAKLEEIAQKINLIAVKTLQEEEEELLNEIQESEEENRKLMEQQTQVYSEESEDESHSEIDPDMNDDLSIDDSLSDNSTESDSSSSLSSLESAGGEALFMSMGGGEANNQAHHNSSSNSLSLAEIHGEMDGEDDPVATSQSPVDQVLLKNGILRIDTTSTTKALICDWDQWLHWSEQQQQEQNDRSSQRWADQSFQDSKFKMPTRRDSDDDHSVISSSQSEDTSYFDWKAWRRRKNGHRSFTSITHSMSDEEFDAKSVLDKLNAWEEMEEALQKEQNGNNNGSNSSTSESQDDGSNQSPKQGGNQRLGRSNAERLKSRRASLPVRTHSDHSLELEDKGNEKEQWKNWQRENRKSRLHGSWSNMSGNLPTTDSEGGGADSHRSLETELTLHEGEASTPARALSEGRIPSRSRPSLGIRSNSLSSRLPSRRSFTLSPLRSPIGSPLTQSVAVGDEWKSWQREKRRSGMLKKTLSANSGWFLAFSEESNTADSKDVATNETSNRGQKMLTKSQSEKWDRKQNDSTADGQGRQQRVRAHPTDPPNTSSSDQSAADLKVTQPGKARNNLNRVQSDRWASRPSTDSKKNDQNKPPSAPSSQVKGIRRAHSEKWQARATGDMTPSAIDGNLEPSSDPKEAFDWKAFRKDRRKTAMKSHSEHVSIRDTSQF